MNYEKLKQQLMNRIDQEDLLEVAKVERLVTLMEDFQHCVDDVKEKGYSTVIENGKQRFEKISLMQDQKPKLNREIISLEKTINFISEDTAATANDVEVSESDLI